jgi:biopolymer transport protein TolQ
MDPIQATPVAPGASGVDLWHLVMMASWPVFLVMIGLALASVWCWAVIVQKYFAFRKVKAADEKFEKAFWSGRSLEELYGALNNSQTVGTASIFVAAMEEWKRSQGAAMRAGFAGVQKRIEKVMDVAIQKEMGGLESRLLSLATTGSAGPFIGLFGTVVGIMISFQGIAASGQTSLAVVAPGIAEALFATAIGLVAAIPATIFYNIFSNDAAKVQSRLENFADEFSAIISRQLDERV